jgi:hypothetical protein
MAVTLHRFIERLFSSPQGGVDVVVRPPATVITVPRRGIPDEYLEKLPPPEARDAETLLAHYPRPTPVLDLPDPQ